MTVAVYSHTDFDKLHTPAGISEGPDRIAAIHQHLRDINFFERANFPTALKTCTPCDEQHLLRNHSAEMIYGLKEACK